MKKVGTGKSSIIFGLFMLLLVSAGCSGRNAVVDSGGGDDLPVRYIAIDIDDIFLPNWDSAANKLGTVKMNADDVRNLVQLSRDIQSEFGSGFKFTLGFNSGYYDSTNSGDRAFLENRLEFRWFNHLPNHDHIQEASLSAARIDTLFASGESFALAHQIPLSSYMVTPQHQGIWPPYEPLYSVFEKYHITTTSSETIASRASYGDVDVVPRHNIGVGSSAYSLTQVGASKLATLSQKDFESVLREPAIIFYTHQSNFAQDRIGELLIRMLLQKLKEQKKFRVVFLPAEDIEKVIFDTPLTTHKTPGP